MTAARARIARGTGPGWPGHLLAVAAGALVPVSLAPVHAWPAGMLAIALLALVLRGQTPRGALLRGWLFGLGLYGAGASWIYVSIHVYGYAPAWLAGALTAAFVMGLALMTAGMAWAWQRWFGDGAGALLLGLPSLWVLVEWLRYWLLTGFPWLYLGYAHPDTWLAGWAPVLGVYGLSWFVALGGATLACWLRPDRRGAGRTAGLVLCAAAWGGGWYLDPEAWTTPVPGGPIDVALVQGNVPQDLKWQREQVLPTLTRYRNLTAPHWDSDLVVWPEAAVPVLMHEARGYLDDLEARARRSGTGLITGIPYRGADPARPDQPVYHNSILGLGQARGLYHKRKLVPFGEYVPLEQWLRGAIRFLDLPMSSFSRGGADQGPLTLLQDGRLLTIAPYICYEIVYPDFVQRTFQGAGLIATISNDAWFGASAGPAQHLQMVRLRALETGRDIVRATNDGISAVIDHRGRVRARAPRFETTVLRGTVQQRTGQTPFAKWGSGPVLVLSAILALLTRRTRRNTDKEDRELAEYMAREGMLERRRDA